MSPFPVSPVEVKETITMVYHPYLKTRNSNHLQMSLILKAALSTCYFKTLRVGLASVKCTCPTTSHMD